MKLTCRHCGSSFELLPSKPGFADECPSCLAESGRLSPDRKLRLHAEGSCTDNPARLPSLPPNGVNLLTKFARPTRKQMRRERQRRARAQQTFPFVARSRRRKEIVVEPVDADTLFAQLKARLDQHCDEMDARRRTRKERSDGIRPAPATSR